MCAMMQKLRVCSIPMKRGNYAGAAKVAQGWGSFFDRGQTLLPESGSGFVEWHTCQRRNVRSRSAIAAGLSRAKGAVSYQPGASPQDLGPHRKQALKARLNEPRFSVNPTPIARRTQSWVCATVHGILLEKCSCDGVLLVSGRIATQLRVGSGSRKKPRTRAARKSHNSALPWP